MNTSTFVWLLLAVSLVKSVVIVKSSSEDSKLDDLVAEYRAMDPPKESLFNDATSTGKGTDLHEPLSLRVIRGGPDNTFYYQLNTSSVLIFDSVENFVEHVWYIKWLINKRFRHPHLVYIPGVNVSDIVEHIKDGFLIDHVGFLVHASDGSIELATSYMFTKEKCRTNQLVTINRFKNVQMGWENTKFYLEKYKNFHGCSLTATPSDNNQTNKLFYDIASTLNLRIWKSSSAVDSKHNDLLGGWDRFDYDKYYITSDTIVTSDLIYVVPPGEPYSQLEKMFLPFDEGTWILICLTFVLAFITVEVIKLCPMKVQNFVFGRNFRTPTLNIFDIFLNGGQRCVPSRNFSRYILNLFTIWCLIIRTCYQSKTFDFLQADMRKPGPTSMEDMGYTEDNDNVMGFDIKVPEDRYKTRKYGDPMNRTKFADCFKNSGSNDDIEECLDIVADPANKAFTLIGSHSLIFILNRIGFGNPSFAILENRWRTIFLGIKFKKFCPFYQTFNQKIGFYVTSGIPQRLTDTNQRKRRRDITWKDEDMGPQVLTLDDLWLGFMIHLVCLSVSTFVFFLELIPIRVKLFIKKLIMRVTMLNVLVAYFRNLFPGGAKSPPKLLGKSRRKPLKYKVKFIKVKPFSPPSNPRYRIDLSTSLWQRSEENQCPTGSASSFCLLNRQARSSTREVGAEAPGSLETSIDEVVGPGPEVQTVTTRALPWWLIGDGRGGMIDISDLVPDISPDIHAEFRPNPKLDVEESSPQCPTKSASDFCMVNFQAGSSTREFIAEEFGSLETSIDDEFGPEPEIQTVTTRALPLTMIEDGRGGFIDISDLTCEDDWIAAGFSPLRKVL